MAEKNNNIPINHDGLQEGMDVIKNVLSNDSERDKFGETIEQSIEHVASIFRSYDFKGKITDSLISKDELKEIHALKLSHYEIDYLTILTSPQNFQK